MPCTPLPGGGFVCGPHRRRCAVGGCTRGATLLCDFPVAPVAFGKPVKTCDMALCAGHATRVSRDQDYCPDHAATLGVR